MTILLRGASLALIFVGLLNFPSQVSSHQLTPEQQELVDMLHNTCLEETGTDPGIVTRAQGGDFSDDDNLKCYMKCIMEQMGCIDDDGNIDVEATIAILPEEYQDQATPIITKCGTQKGTNACDNAFLTNKCWYKEAPQDYFLV